MKAKYITPLILLLLSASLPSYTQCTLIASGALTFSSDPSPGNIIWTNTSGSQFSENNRAQSGYLLGVLATVHTDYLDARSFGFTLPAESVICGIELSVEKRGQGIIIGSSIKDNEIKLMKNGTPCGTDHSSSTAWATTDEIVTYGGPGDLWGTTWTAADINAADFGCLISAQMNSGLAGVFLQAEIDYIKVSVHYSAPLPIELENFDLSLLENKQVKLDWTTATEHNNDYFNIERSSNGTEWQNIKQIKGAGNSDCQVRYSHTDEKPLDGISYYRLKQTDFDNAITYSPVKSIDRNADDLTVGVGPNPTGNFIVLSCSNNTDVFVKLCLYNVQGQLVKEIQPVEMKKGGEPFEIPVNELRQGMYFYKASANEKVFSGKIVKN